MKKIISILLAAVISATFVTASQAALLGDIDGNGKVTSNDALEVLLHSVGQKTLDAKIADINKDSVINSSDALEILKICVGTSTLPDDTLKTSYYEDTVKPVLASGTYTINTTVNSDGTMIDAKLMVKGNDVCTELNYGVKARILFLNNKAYMVFPDLRVYSELEDQDVDLDMSMSPSDGGMYVGSEEVTLDGKKCIRENYEYKDGSKSAFYFLDGKWVGMENDGEFMKITGFSSKVDNSAFSLKGLTKVDLSNMA